MSELFIKQLAQRVTRHPDFQRAMEAAVGSVLQTVITTDFAGERFSLYAAKRPASKRLERDARIRGAFTGKNADILAKLEGLSPRMVRKIAKGK